MLASLSVAAALIACGSAVLSTRGALSVAPRSSTTPQDKRRLAVVDTGPSDDLDLRVTPVVKAVRRAADSVVSIYVIHQRRLRDWGPVRSDGQGSGVILDDDGLVITNWHVVARAGRGSPYRIKVRLTDDQSHDAEVLSSSPRYDLALLQLDLPAGEKLEPATLGRSDSLMVGETVIAIGNPRGNANSVTVGVLSAQERTIRVRAPDGSLREYEGLLQTDAAINQGNSGGALLDITGKLIGINNAMAVGAENIGFAIPVDTVKRVFEDVLLSSENLASVWFGMKVRDRGDAVVVTAVEPDGPAARAGIRSGDLILEANGEDVANALEYARRTLRARPGRAFPLRVQRDGRVHRARPVPLSTAAWEVVRRVGLQVEEVTPEEDRALVERATREFYAGTRYARVPLLPVALRVTRVHAEGTAAELGLREGDVLLGITEYSFLGARNVPFHSIGDLADKLRDHAGRSVSILVLRDGEGLTGELAVRR